ncbi:nucleotidyl transferase AbiEii/AbiGii toxin family protein [Thioalkalivibrio thiocyanoxidans]|uniref:nucleotidyl transferase AbiEii/AbiGii toxin family protein n=1 Tax=Thioalkalivibrio thiocyanoxidans TaxID=152475 RepID=UPI0003809777|nr:nucleotidyl transferase AbiEii/AbiGii toxin family protein [Thioalkalivibrio thiocyanoxidans]
MNRVWLDVSNRIDPLLAEALGEINRLAADLGIPFVVVGATARDMVLHHGFSLEVRRATRDIDLALEIAHWGTFQDFENGLLATGRFRSDRAAAQRLLYTVAQRPLPVDLIPFGRIESAGHAITWPPEHVVQLNVQGFADASRAARPVRVKADPPTDVQCISPSGLALLKLIAWDDARQDGRRRRDAEDLRYLVETYLDAGNRDRLFEEHASLLDREDFDYVEAGVHILGSDLTALMAPATRTSVIEILARESAPDGPLQLVGDMLTTAPHHPAEPASIRRLLEVMLDGIRASSTGQPRSE